MKRIRKGVMLLLLVMLFLAGCSETNSLQDGYYTAQALAYNYGWKEYITIMVKGGSIVSVEYNAEMPAALSRVGIMPICRTCCILMAPIPMNILVIMRDSF